MGSRDYLARPEIRLILDGDQLHVEAPAGTLTARVLDAFKEVKPAILAALRGSTTPGASSLAQEPAPETRRLTWDDLSHGERAVVAKVRALDSDRFDRMLVARFAEGMITGEAEIRVVLDLLDRELGIDRGEDPSQE